MAKSTKIVIVIVLLIILVVFLGFLREGYPVIISESELNKHLTEAFVSPYQFGDNPLISTRVTLYEGKGVLEAQWTKDQTLTAEIQVSPDGKNLSITNVNVSGAGFLTGFFEKLAYDFLDYTAKTFLITQNGKRLEQAEIKPGKLILRYQIRP